MLRGEHPLRAMDDRAEPANALERSAPGLLRLQWYCRSEHDYAFPPAAADADPRS